MFLRIENQDITRENGREFHAQSLESPECIWDSLTNSSRETLSVCLSVVSSGSTERAFDGGFHDLVLRVLRY